jgi:hypothetical protein
VTLLIGNHDFHYTPTAGIFGDQYSGYQKKKAMEIGYELQKNMHLLQMAHAEKLQYETVLFTHAGVTNTWIKRTMGLTTTDEVSLVGIPIDEYINNVWQHKPNLFLFNGIDPFGDDVTQSPIWVRPDSLSNDALPGYVQVVGHTSVKRIGVEPLAFLDGGSGFFIDTLGHSGEYLILEDGKVSIGKV